MHFEDIGVCIIATSFICYQSDHIYIRYFVRFFDIYKTFYTAKSTEFVYYAYYFNICNITTKMSTTI
jgi:hypothetical protein